MHNENNDPGDEYRGDEALTGEYPPPSAAARGPTDSLQPLNGTAHDVAGESSPSPVAGEAEVSAWLADLEAEVAWLHERWQQVEHGFGAKDGLIAELKTEVASRDGALADVRARLERSTEALTALERLLLEKNDAVASLSAELTHRAAIHEQSGAAVATVTAERQVAQSDLETARAEIVRLNAVVEREQTAGKALVTRNDQLVAAQAAMTLRIEELEAYINGRAQSWSGLKTETTEQKDTILRLEKRLKTKDATIDNGARLRRELEQKLVDLERRDSEISGRGKQREAANDELQGKLTEQVALVEQLKADLAKRIEDHDRVLMSASIDYTLIATLESAVREKDAALAALEIKLAANQSAADERLQALEHDLAQRDATLAQSHERPQRKPQRAMDLNAASDVKRRSVDRLKRRVHRISNLGASVSELERRIESSHSARRADEPAVPTINATPPVGAAPAELLPLESFLSLGASKESARDDHAAKLIGSFGGEKVSFPLSKGEMTIGRGKRSDIRISSHFISRLHAKISTRGIATTIEDIGSKNGIFVNSSRIKRCVLRDGDVVSLASELHLQFVDAPH